MDIEEVTMDIQEVNMVDENPDDPIENNNNSNSVDEGVVVSIGVRFLPTDYKLITTYLNRRQEGLHKLLPDNRIRDVDDVFSCSPSILFEKYRLNKHESWYFLSKLKKGYKRSLVATGDGQGYWNKGINTENVYDPNTNVNAYRGGLSLNPNAMVNANAYANANVSMGGLSLSSDANANFNANANANRGGSNPNVNVNANANTGGGRTIVGHMRNLYFYSRRGDDDAAAAIKTNWVMRIYTSTATNLQATAPSTSAGPMPVVEAIETESGDVALCKIYNSEHLY